MQWSVHHPSDFLCRYSGQLLPTWTRPIASVLIVLQPSQFELLERTAQVEAQKNHLRQQFLHFGDRIAGNLKALGHLAEIFDPRTGLPLLSEPGTLVMDDVATVQACLGYEISDRCGCWVILHPTWGCAVYPSTLVSSATPEVLQPVCQQWIPGSALQATGVAPPLRYLSSVQA